MAKTHNVKSTRGDTSRVQYKIPMGISPWAKNGTSDGNVWISMKPSKILDQTSKGAGTYSTVDPSVEFLFLAPLALNENIVHHWEAYESVASRVAQKARSLTKLHGEASAIGNAVTEAVGAKLKSISQNFLNKDAKNKDVSSPTAAKEVNTVEGYITKAYSMVPGAKIPKIKVDTPLYYTNSDRRQLTLEFQLYNEGAEKKANDFLLKPIHELMKYSSPDLINEGGINIEFPYMWKVETLPVPFISYTTCALTAVQPTWNSPYINGYPISCNLQLTFIDLSPLYAGTIQYGSIINVISPSTTEKKGGSKQSYIEKQNEIVKRATDSILYPTPKT